MTRFKKGSLTKEAFETIMYDLETLEIKNNRDQQHHYQLLKSNLQDIFGYHFEADWYGTITVPNKRKKKWDAKHEIDV